MPPDVLISLLWGGMIDETHTSALSAFVPALPGLCCPYTTIMTYDTDGLNIIISCKK
jgi:hypothetical protein